MGLRQARAPEGRAAADRQLAPKGANSPPMNESNLTVPRAIEPVIRRIDLMEAQLAERLDIAMASISESANARRPSRLLLILAAALCATLLALFAAVAIR